MDWWITFDQQAADYLPDLRIREGGAHEPPHLLPHRRAGPADGLSGAGGAAGAAAGHGRPPAAPGPWSMGNGTEPAGPGRGAGPAGDRHLRRPEPSWRPAGSRDTFMAEAGVPPWPRLADFACRQGLTGLEFAHGIPGTVGGAVCMNAGAYGGEMEQVVRERSPAARRRASGPSPAAEMAFGYRRSSSHGSSGCGGAAGGVFA